MRRNSLYLLIVVSLIILPYAIINKVTQSPQNEFEIIPDSVLFTSAPVLSPNQALHTFRLPEGFKIELVACEPLIQDPVAMDFDERGRIWVVEMQSYMQDVEGSNEAQKISRILILDDQDGDGVMDQSTIFLDSLALPRALSIVKDGILYAEPPNLWFVENINDKAGKKVLVDSIYAVGGNPEHQPNGLMRGMDNWHYNAKSRSRYKYQDGQWAKQETEFRGQWGITKDNYGRLFYNTNSNQLRGDLVPANSFNRNPDFNLSGGINVEIANDQSVFPIRPTSGINRGYQEHMLNKEQKLQKFTAACGPVIYRGDKFPKEFEGNAFVCEPAANLIKRNILFEEGPYVKSKPAYQDYEFLASTDERFRPVNLYNGPDGNLYVVDMYRGIIQHIYYLTDYLRNEITDRSLEKPIGLGRIYRITYEGDAFQSFINKFKSSPKVDLGKVSDATLIAYLSHPNGWWRDTAQRILIERSNKSTIPGIVKILKEKNGDNLAKIHALWTLEGMDAISPEIIQLACESDDPKVIATALRVAESLKKHQDAGKMLEILEQVSENNDALVQLQLSISTGEFMKVDSATVLNILKNIAIKNGDDTLISEAILSSITSKEKRFLSELKDTLQENNHMVSFLEENIEKVAVKKQLEGKQLNKAERKHFALGRSLYMKTCAGCHQEKGEGLLPIAPPLDNSEWVTGPEDRLILVALHGLKGPVTVNGKIYKEPEIQPEMPGFKNNKEFTDENLAALLTYLRNAWNNEADPIKPATVHAVRVKSMGRKEPFREIELLGKQ